MVVDLRGGEVPSLASGAEIGAEERGVCTTGQDGFADPAGNAFAVVAGFSADSGQCSVPGLAGQVSCGGGVVGVDGVRMEPEFAQHFVDPGR